MRRMVAGGFAAAMVLAAGAAQAQLGPPIWAPAEVYIGGGALYGMGKPFSALTGVNSFDFSETDLFGPAGFVFGGTRVPFRGMFFGVEGEYDSTGRRHTRSIDTPGRSQTVTANITNIVFTGPFISTTNQAFPLTATVGARSEEFTADLSNRIGLFATAFLPIAGVELFGKAGVTYTKFTQSYSIAFNSPAGLSATSGVCLPSGCFGGAALTTFTAQGATASATEHLFAPAVGAGIQVPFGNFFVRIEGQVDLRWFEASEIRYFTAGTQTAQPVPSGAATSVNLAPSPGRISSAFGTDHSDARVMLSVGYKW